MRALVVRFLSVFALAAAAACAQRPPQYEYVAAESNAGGDSTLYLVRVVIDSSRSQVRYLMLSPRHEIQIFGAGGTFNPEVVLSECRVFDAENFSCANFNVLLQLTVGRLVMTDGVLKESGVDGVERLYSKRATVTLEVR